MASVTIFTLLSQNTVSCKHKVTQVAEREK